LSAAWFIERIRNPADERQAFVELTERGQSLEDRAACLGPRFSATAAALGAARESGSMLAARITLPHIAVSRATKLSKSAGEPASTS